MLNTQHVIQIKYQKLNLDKSEIKKKNIEIKLEFNFGGKILKNEIQIVFFFYSLWTLFIWEQVGARRYHLIQNVFGKMDLVTGHP